MNEVRICLCVILSLLISFASCQVCPGPSSPSYILTENELQQYQSCNSLNSSLVIGMSDCSQECTVTSLSSLSSVTSIVGDFIIQCCNQLATIPSLIQLTEVTGTVRVFNNAQLLNIAGFSGLRTAGNVDIYQNPSLVSITGLGSLGLTNGYVAIGNNAKLTRIQGFDSLIRINGQTLSSDHGLVIVYNPLLTDITGFRSIVSISIGSVHIEGNTNLCYAGYPVWSYGQYSNRYTTGDKGIDWRSVMESQWQFTWGGTTVPSLVIQNNGNETICETATCSDACAEGVGCFGPDDPSYCGISCYNDDNINSCEAVERPVDPGTICPGWWPPTQEPFTTLFVLVVSFGVVIILVLLVLLCVMGCKIRQCMKGEKQGNYSVTNKSVESGYQSHKHVPSHSSPISDLKSNDRTVLGRGAGSSSTSSSPDPNYLYSVPNKGKSNKRQTGTKDSDSNSTSNGGVRFSTNGAATVSANLDRSSPKQVQIPDKPYSHVLYSDVEVPSSFSGGGEQLKDPLKSSEIVLHSINERKHSTPIPVSIPIPTTAEVHETYRSPNMEGGGGEGGETWGDQLSDVGQGMRQQLRDGVWSEGYDSFDDLGPNEDEAIDGDRRQQEQVETVDDYYSGMDQYSVNDIQLGTMLGKGSFGKVFEADVYGMIEGSEEMTHVVVKQSNDNATEEELQVFFQPAYAMKTLKHDNVLPLLGVSFDGPNMYIILEYCSNGSLKTFLSNQAKNDVMRLKCEGTIHQILLDVAYGVSYFHSMGIAHNDLAARNCLVTDKLRVKVGDYGLSRTTFRGDYYSRTPGQMTWPIRWMSPEVLIVNDSGILDSSPATEASNVWSYGILLWEVCSFGELPYPKMTDEQVIGQLKTSRQCTMTNPVPDTDPLCSFYEIMKLCWGQEANRISMIELLQSISSAKDNYVPVKYSNKPSRPAPKKPSQRQTPNKQSVKHANTTPFKSPPQDITAAVQQQSAPLEQTPPSVKDTMEQMKQKLNPMMGGQPSSEQTGGLSPKVTDSAKELKEERKKQKSMKKGRKSQRSKPEKEKEEKKDKREEKEEVTTLPKKQDSWDDIDENLFMPTSVPAPPTSVSTPPTVKQDQQPLTHSSPPTQSSTSSTNGGLSKSNKQRTQSRIVKGKSMDEGKTKGEVPAQSEPVIPPPNEQVPPPPPPPPLPSVSKEQPKLKVPVTVKPSSPPVVAPKPKRDVLQSDSPLPPNATTPPLLSQSEQHSLPSMNSEKTNKDKQLKTEKKKQKSLKKRNKEPSKSDEKTGKETVKAPVKQQSEERKRTPAPPPPHRVSSLPDNGGVSTPPAVSEGGKKNTDDEKEVTTKIAPKDITDGDIENKELSKKHLKKQDTWGDFDEDMFENDENQEVVPPPPLEEVESKKPLKKQDTWGDFDEDMFDTAEDNNEEIPDPEEEEDDDDDDGLTPPIPPSPPPPPLNNDRPNDDDLQLHRLSTGSDISRSNLLAQLLAASGQKQDNELASVSGSDTELDLAPAPWPTGDEPHPPPEEYGHDDEDTLPRQSDDNEEKKSVSKESKNLDKKLLKKQDTWADFDEDMFDTTEENNEVPDPEEEDDGLTPPIPSSPPPPLNDDRPNNDDLQLHRLSTGSDISRSNLLAQLLAASEQKQDEELASVSGSDNEHDLAPAPWPTEDEPHPPPEEYGHDDRDTVPRQSDDNEGKKSVSKDSKNLDKKLLKKQDTWGDFDEDMFDTAEDNKEELDVPDPEEEEDDDDDGLTPPIPSSPPPPPLDDDRPNDDDLQLHRLSTGSDISRSNLLAQLLAASGQKQDNELASVSGSDNEHDLAPAPWPTEDEPHPPPEEYGHDNEDKLPQQPANNMDEEHDSWDEFDMEDKSVDKLVDPSIPAEVRRKESAQRRESFMLPPDSPEATPPLVRRPSYVSELEKLKEEDLRIATSDEYDDDDDDDDDEAPPPVPDSLPPDDNEDDDNEMITKFDEGPPILPDPSSTIPEPQSTVPDLPPIASDPSPTSLDPPPPPASDPPPSTISDPTSSRAPAMSYRKSKKPLSPAPPPPPSTGGSKQKKRNTKSEKATSPPPTDSLPSSTAKVEKDSTEQSNQPTVDDDDEFLDMPVKLDFLPVQTVDEPVEEPPKAVKKAETAKERKQREKMEKKEMKRRRSTLRKQKAKGKSQNDEFW